MLIGGNGLFRLGKGGCIEFSVDKREEREFSEWGERGVKSWSSEGAVFVWQGVGLENGVEWIRVGWGCLCEAILARRWGEVSFGRWVYERLMRYVSVFVGY